MNAGDGHTSDGVHTVRRSRKLRFLRPQDSGEIKPQSDYLPVFLAPPPAPVAPAKRHPFHDVRSQAHRSISDVLIAYPAIIWVAWKGWLNQFCSSLSLHRQPLEVPEHVTRIALILLLAPLPIIFSPNRTPRLAETVPPAFALEDRLAFGRGLADRLTSQARVLNLEQSVVPTKRARDAAPPTPHAEEEKRQATLRKFDAGGHEGVPMVMDERRWTLPFDSTDYAIEYLPATPEASFRTEITVPVATSEPPSITAENDRPTTRVQRPKRRAERRKKPPVQVRIVRLETLPPAVQAAILQRQAAAAPPPFPFFLGAPSSPNPPVSARNTPPKKTFLFPESIHDTFKNEY